MNLDLTATARIVPLTALILGACVSQSTYDKQTAELQRARAKEIMMLRKYHLIAVVLLGFFVSLLSSCAPTARRPSSLSTRRRRRLSTRISGDCSSEKDARNRTDRRSAKAMNPNLRMSMIKIVEEPMKRPTRSLILLVGVAICALQPGAATNAQGLGPSMNKGLNYDGTYAGVSVVNNSQGNTWTSGGSQPCVQEPAPTMTITHGHAEFPWQSYTLSGNVTPSGYMMLTSSFGQVFEGSINPQYRITGQVTGYCTYDLTFQKQG